MRHLKDSVCLLPCPTQTVFWRLARNSHRSSICMYMPCYSSSIDVCIYIYISLSIYLSIYMCRVSLLNYSQRVRYLVLLNTSASKIHCNLVGIEPDISPFGLLTNVFLIVGCICCLPHDSAFLLPFAQI